MSTKALKIMNCLCIAVFIFLMIFVFVLPSGYQELLVSVFSFVYRTGSWIIGIGLLFNYLWGQGKQGIIFGTILLACYIITTFITMFGLMALTNEWDLLWYIHPIIIIPGCLIALLYRKKKSKG